MWQRRDSSFLVLWFIYIMSSIHFLGFCRGELSEADLLVDFMRAIDPEYSIANSWNRSRSDHCSGLWVGVNCNSNRDTITEIRLENLNLRGKIDADSLCKLPSLLFLSLANNFIRGSIPDSISNCVSMTHLNLSSNLLSGRVPESLKNLTNLRSLDISNNNFSGSVASFIHDKVNSNPHYSPYPSPASSPLPIQEETKNRGRVLGYVPFFLTFTLFILVIVISSKKIPRTLKETVKYDSYKDSPIKIMSLDAKEENKSKAEQQELVFFIDEHERFKTEDLLGSAAELQGQGICSSLYKVTLRNNSTFVVKRMKKLQVPTKEFGRVMTQIGSLKHPNILPLAAYHSSEEEKLLIYRYQRNRSLLYLLENYAEGKRDFSWGHRLSIASGIARGLDYIYQAPQLGGVPHGNLKLSNILLSENEEPLISEYGFQRFLDPKSACLFLSNGYRAPEKKLTQKADIFSFGIILLELLTGKTVEKSGLDLPKWVRSTVGEEWTEEVFDKEVNRAGKKWAFPLLNVALKCVSHLPEKRPSMAEVLNKIDEVMGVEDFSFASTSSVESNYQDSSLLHTVIPETRETPGSNS